VSTVEPISSASAEETEAAGTRLADHLRAGDVVLLEGDLAAGKTTFVRGLLRGLGGNAEAVSSPSFVLLQTYDCSARGIDTLHHVDLYRLGENIGDLRELGLEEVLSDDAAVVAVEWPKNTLAAWIPTDARTWRVGITTKDDDSRQIEIIPPSEQGS
jgi:tRNA threonylcarbamoyladenosine biosynthesis protein TsaE